MSQSNMQRIRKKYCSDIPGELNVLIKNKIIISHKIKKVSYVLLYNSDSVKSAKWQGN